MDKEKVNWIKAFAITAYLFMGLLLLINFTKFIVYVLLLGVIPTAFFGIMYLVKKWLDENES